MKVFYSTEFTIRVFITMKNMTSSGFQSNELLSTLPKDSRTAEFFSGELITFSAN